MNSMHSIAVKITSGFAINVVFGVLLVVVLLSLHEDVNVQLERVKSEYLPDMIAISDGRIALERVQVAAYGRYALSIDDDGFQSAIERELEVLRDKKLGIKADYVTSVAESLSSISDVMNQSSVDWDEARALLAELARQGEMVQSELSRKAQEIEKNAKQGSQIAWEKLRAADLYTQGLVVFLILAAILAFVLVKKYISGPVAALSFAIERSAKNRDLSVAFDENSQSEIGLAARSINYLFKAFKETISTTHKVSNELENSAQDLNAVVISANASVEQQMNHAERLMHVVDDFGQGISEVSNQALEAQEGAEEGLSQSASGFTEVEQTVEHINFLAKQVEEVSIFMKQLDEESSHISKLVEVIQQIAEQTNLLALNAAIEAARAGESGRGFAVVADEVRQLAIRTQEATGEIQKVIEEVSHSMSVSVNAMSATQITAQNSVKQAQRAGSSLNAIRTAINTIVEANRKIAASTTHHEKNMNEVQETVNVMCQLANSVHGETSKVERASSSLVNHMRTLSDEVKSFKA